MHLRCFCFVLAFSMIETTRTFALSAIRVWDNTLPSETLSILHKQAAQRGLGHHIFKRAKNRNDQDSGLNSPIEQALDDLLTQLNDTSPIVEYWSRQEWKHIEAHADIDELLVRQQQHHQIPMKELSFRHPKNGHVLYLQVGFSVHGPTCLFPTCQFGGDLVRNADQIPVVTVPAVPSRLLRFQGDFLHAVPRPFDIWFRKFVVGVGETEPIEQWGRSVILFNTWEEEHGGPLDVSTINLEKEMTFCFNDRDEAQAISAICQNLDYVNANDIKMWKEMKILQNSNLSSEDGCVDEAIPNYSPAKIWLLGDYPRRKSQSRTVKVAAPEQQMRNALEERSQVYETILEQL